MGQQSAHSTMSWHMTACRRQLTGLPPLAGCQTTLSGLQSGCCPSTCKGGVNHVVRINLLYASSHHIEHNCRPQATHRFPPLAGCRMTLAGSQYGCCPRSCKGGVKHGVHISLLCRPAYSTWHMTACRRQLTGPPPLAGYQTTLAPGDAIWLPVNIL